jgi:tetratricopeptide (TPR) repeat protein
MMNSLKKMKCFFGPATAVAPLLIVVCLLGTKVNAQSYMKLCSSGISLENAGSLDDAIAKYTTAITLKPDAWAAYSYRAKVYYRKGKYEQAIVDISKAIELSPKKMDLYHVRANCYLAKKNYDKAIPDYNMALLKIKAKDKQVYQTYLYRGECYYFNKQYSEAVADFTKSMQLMIKQNITVPVYAYYYRALCYYELKKYTDAITEFDNILSTTPTNSYAIFYQGLCYKLSGETAKAKVNALKLVELDPSKEVYFSGEKAMDILDLEARRKIVTPCVDLAKKDIKEYKSNKTSTIGTIKLAEAFAQLDKAWLYSSGIEKDDQDVRDTILERIGYVYSVMTEKPELPELARKYLVQANAFTQDKKYNNAIATFNKAISIAPYYPLAYYNRSLVYELLSEYSNAIEDMKKYIELDPAAANVRSAQDKIYEWEGNKKTTSSYVFNSADGKNSAISNTEASMNSMAIEIENVIANKIETDNKAIEGFFVGYGLSTPRGEYGTAPEVPIISTDSTLWKQAIFDKGQMGITTGWYLEIGGQMNMEQKPTKVRFHYNPFILSMSKNKVDWTSKSNPVFSGTDSSKAYHKIELAQRYGISYAPIPKLVFAFYYRIGMTLPVTNYKVNYQTTTATGTSYFKLTSENKAQFIPFAHTLGFSVSYSFITLLYETYFVKERYQFTARYFDSSTMPVEQSTTFNGKFPMRTSRIGISIHF